DQGLEVLVANARKVRAIYQNTYKNDEADAKLLARLTRFDSELLYPIQHVSEEHQCDLLQVKLRDNLVRQRLGLRLPSPNTNW
ncbi:MAG: hypothetical protein ACPGAP_00435, partial [Akkermansiaceae bacterium]